MGLPKSWKQIRQGAAAGLISEKIEWDGESTEAAVNVPLGSLRPVKIAVDNTDCGKALTITLEEHLRTDDAQATAKIGEGDNGVVTVTVDGPGPDGEECGIEVVVPEAEEVTDLEVTLADKIIIVALALKEEGEEIIPDDAKNTAALIAVAVGELENFSAEASGNGSTPFTEAIEPVNFTGGKVNIWAEVINAFSLTAAPDKIIVLGPFDGWPRFLGGRIKLDAAEAPDDGDATLVMVQEV
ncbi:hypothetical protein [Candidatus Contubernalis alkaliaceticus]|uniref:hypothetical protein n=1 Tax=Candidatus Contubernalis alkaliaceticus TaxID=338645 RepID=UPI001F4C40DA|nr:hypothetical protein [Candidatus Contubernalis alkalaceticus]UNC91692.1 hypothetical protein HUE98_06050 [Candidatus Contubernalis alkalaceticus]